MGKKIVSCGGVFDLAVEQPQLFRKLPKNKQKTYTCGISLRIIIKDFTITQTLINEAALNWGFNWVWIANPKPKFKAVSFSDIFLLYWGVSPTTFQVNTGYNTVLPRVVFFVSLTATSVTLCYSAAIETRFTVTLTNPRKSRVASVGVTSVG